MTASRCSGNGGHAVDRDKALRPRRIHLELPAKFHDVDVDGTFSDESVHSEGALEELPAGENPVWCCRGRGQQPELRSRAIDDLIEEPDLMTHRVDRQRADLENGSHLGTGRRDPA
jgi:hypothetical protein